MTDSAPMANKTMNAEQMALEKECLNIPPSPTGTPTPSDESQMRSNDPQPSQHMVTAPTTPVDTHDTISQGMNPISPNIHSSTSSSLQDTSETSTKHKSAKTTVVSDRPRPFKCNVCQSAFSRQHDLKRHQRLHDGTKPYQCPHCARTFSRQDALSRHLRVDGGSAPCCGFRKPTQHTVAQATVQGSMILDPAAIKGGAPNSVEASVMSPFAERGQALASPTTNLSPGQQHYRTLIQTNLSSPTSTTANGLNAMVHSGNDMVSSRYTHHAIGSPHHLSPVGIPSSSMGPHAHQMHPTPSAHPHHQMYSHHPTAFDDPYNRQRNDAMVSTSHTDSAMLQQELMSLRKQVFDLQEESRMLRKKCDELRQKAENSVDDKDKKIEELQSKVNALEIEKNLLRSIVMESSTPRRQPDGEVKMETPEK